MKKTVLILGSFDPLNCQFWIFVAVWYRLYRNFVRCASESVYKGIHFRFLGIICYRKGKNKGNWLFPWSILKKISAAQAKWGHYSPPLNPVQLVGPHKIRRQGREIKLKNRGGERNQNYALIYPCPEGTTFPLPIFSH